MPLRLRVKGPDGQSKTVTSPDDESMNTFILRMKELFNIAESVEVLNGYPPQLCAADKSELISNVLKSGESIALREVKHLDAPLPTRIPSTEKKDSVSTERIICKGDSLYYRSAGGSVDLVSIIEVHPGPPATPESYTAVVIDSLDCNRTGRELNVQHMSSKLSWNPPEDSNVKSVFGFSAPNHSTCSHSEKLSTTWTCAACTFVNQASDQACEMCETRRKLYPQEDLERYSRGVSGSARRHRIPDDNSCLFHAFVFLLHRTDSPQELRNMIANTVRENPLKWNDGILGKSRDSYIRYISDPEKWGGQVELSILSAVGGVEIATVDIQTGRVDVYGQGCNYSHRVYMLFSGIHFDAVTFSQDNSVTEVFANDLESQESVCELAETLRSQGEYTDNQRMELVCQTCGFEMKGDYEARLHAGSSGHTDFRMKKSH